MNCPLTNGNFSITSTNNAFLINALPADVLYDFGVILFNLIYILVTRFGIDY